jgi:uncharacterized protein involved in exopolysaccharide biosynthesis
VENDEADGQSILLALTRRWKWLAAGAIAGILVASLLVLVLPKRYTATGDVLLHGAQGDSAEQLSRMETAAELAHSFPVAERALQKLGIVGDPEKLLDQYRVLPLTNELLRVEARAASPEAAASRVSAVAEAYLDYLADEGDQDLASIQQSVETRVAALEARIAELDAQIATLGGPADALTAEQELRLAQRETLANELASAQATLDQAQADHRLALDRNKLVAEPVLPKRPSSPRWREFLVVGFMLGTFVAAGVVVARDVLSRRLFRREELARAAGVSVIASPTLRAREWIGGRGQAARLAKLVASPPPELSVATGSLESVLCSRADASPPRLVVVSMAAEAEALVMVLRLATDLAGRLPATSQRREPRHGQRSAGAASQALRAQGILVIDVTAGERPMIGPVLRAVRGVTVRADEPALDAERTFRVTRTSEGALEWKPIGIRPDTLQKLDFLIAFAGDWRSAAATAHQLRVIEPGASVIVARSGRVTAANVQESAAALRRAGAPPLGVVVVNPDRFDTSTGQLDTAPSLEVRLPTQVETSTRGPERSALRRL